ALALATGLPLGVVYPLWNNTSKRFDRKTIEVLCEQLQVPAGLILEYQPDAKKEA
ncbi:MAG: helix-turn-helix domain-containing protein, partial [Blastocatellia bacterium]